LFFLTTTAFAGMEATFALWANSGFGWGPQQVGELFFYIGIVLVLVQGGLVRPLSRSLGESRMALIGSVLLLLGLGGLPFSTDLPRLLIDMALLATGFGILNPAVTSLVSRAAGTTERGGILGVNQSGQSLARILGPLIGGAVYGAVGRDAPYYVGAVIMVAVVLMTATLPRGEKTR
jgi:MFS family permease